MFSATAVVHQRGHHLWARHGYHSVDPQQRPHPRCHVHPPPACAGYDQRHLHHTRVRHGCGRRVHPGAGAVRPSHTLLSGGSSLLSVVQVASCDNFTCHSLMCTGFPPQRHHHCIASHLDGTPHHIVSQCHTRTINVSQCHTRTRMHLTPPCCAHCLVWCRFSVLPGEWSACSASCGSGTQTRSLSCVNGIKGAREPTFSVSVGSQVHLVPSAIGSCRVQGATHSRGCICIRVSRFCFTCAVASPCVRLRCTGTFVQGRALSPSGL